MWLVSRPPTHRRGITERSHNNNAVNQRFVYPTYCFVYLIGFQYFYYCHKEGIKKAYSMPRELDERTHEVVCLPSMLRQTTNKKERPIDLSFFILAGLDRRIRIGGTVL